MEYDQSQRKVYNHFSACKTISLVIQSTVKIHGKQLKTKSQKGKHCHKIFFSDNVTDTSSSKNESTLWLWHVNERKKKRITVRKIRLEIRKLFINHYPSFVFTDNENYVSFENLEILSNQAVCVWEIISFLNRHCLTISNSLFRIYFLILDDKQNQL